MTARLSPSRYCAARPTNPALRDEYESLDVKIELGVRVAHLDADLRRLVLTDGRDYAFDVAVLACGATPRRLAGVLDRPGLHVLRSLDDSLALRSGMLAAGGVTVVGGGFIGCEVAANATRLGLSVTLVEALAAPLVGRLGVEGAAIVEAMHRAHGVELRTGVTVTEVQGAERVNGVVLSDGSTIETTQVVIGLGVKPDVDWLDDSGLELSDGIKCTAGGRTSIPGVYAVGDVANWWHPLVDGHRRIEHWTSAAEQAMVVAANIVLGASWEDDAVELAETPYFWSDQYDVKMQAVGLLSPDADIEVITLPRGQLIIYCRGGVLVGALGFSAARTIMRLRPLIAARATREQALRVVGD